MLQSYFANRAANSPLAPIVAACRRAFASIALTSGVINVLTLTGSIFMMQVYDRVLGSQSLSTLAGLSLMAVVAYAFQGWLEVIRTRILTLIGEKVDAEIGPALQTAGLKAATSSPTGLQDAIQTQRDLEAIRSFVGGAGLIALFDMPWILLYVVATTFLHPLFGLTTAIAALLFIWLTWRNEKLSKPLLKDAGELGIRRAQMADGIIRNSEVVVANGMMADMARRLTELQIKYLQAQRQASWVITSYGTAAKTLRMILQSFVLGLGAYLAIKGQISAGAIIGASIMIARALAPIDQAIASWRPFVAARDGHERLTKLMTRYPARKDPMSLPAPKATFAVKDLAVVAPGGTGYAVAAVTFDLKAGEAAAVIGQSASGKSSLFRAIVGAWKLSRGLVELDGTSPDQWASDVLGKHIGYMPQDVQLFDGTIAENIARFDPEATPEKIQAAAAAAGLDAYIRAKFPDTGYNTELAPGATNLSGGQRQRLGLARALYGDPFLIVLDEPNSNLDRAGKEALGAAIRAVKARGGIVIVSAHDHNVLVECDKLLTLHQGQPEWFGPRDEVLKRWLEKHHPDMLNLPRPQASPGQPSPSTGYGPIKSLPPGQTLTPGLRPGGRAVAPNGQRPGQPVLGTGHASLPNGAGQGYPGQNYPGQNYPGQNYPGQNYPGLISSGQNTPGQNNLGQNNLGQNNLGQNNVGQNNVGQSGAGQQWSSGKATFQAGNRPGHTLRPAGPPADDKPTGDKS